MKAKTITLLFFLAILSMGINAMNSASETTWKKEISAHRDSTISASKEFLSLTKDGELYAFGQFNNTFSFAGTDLENIATSAYLIKYANDGTEKWGVAIAGAAMPTAITTDDAGNIYIAGKHADQLAFGTTKGDAVEKEGNSGKSLESAFVAKYSKDGELLNVQTFIAKKFDKEYDATPDIYISNIQTTGNDIYISLVLRGEVENNGLKISGALADPWGIGYFIDIRTAYVLSLNSSLTMKEVVAEMRATDGLKNVLNCNFSIADNTIYSGFVATGNQTLKIGETTKTFNFATPDSGAWEYGYIMASYNLGTKKSFVKEYTTKHQSSYNRCNINKITANESGLFVEGTFNGAPLAFDSLLTHKGACDVFVAKLNKNTLAVEKASTSGIDEGNANKNSEFLMGSAIVGDNVNEIIATQVDGKHLISSFLQNNNFNPFSTKQTQDTDKIFTTGIAENKDYEAKATITTDKNSKITFEVTKKVTNSVKNRLENKIRIFPNPTTEILNFSEPCNVQIFSINGTQLNSAKNVNSIDVQSLANGIYFIKISNNKGELTSKFVKK